tara:strand:+ start:384 stop:551 length:168 start_codon:yes stop_codon:yes gene_type:complete
MTALECRTGHTGVRELVVRFQAGHNDVLILQAEMGHTRQIEQCSNLWRMMGLQIG